MVLSICACLWPEMPWRQAARGVAMPLSLGGLGAVPRYQVCLFNKVCAHTSSKETRLRCGHKPL